MWLPIGHCDKRWTTTTQPFSHARQITRVGLTPTGDLLSLSMSVSPQPAPTGGTWFQHLQGRFGNEERQGKGESHVPGSDTIAHYIQQVKYLKTRKKKKKKEKEHFQNCDQPRLVWSEAQLCGGSSQPRATTTATSSLSAALTTGFTAEQQWTGSSPLCPPTQPERSDCKGGPRSTALRVEGQTQPLASPHGRNRLYPLPNASWQLGNPSVRPGGEPACEALRAHPQPHSPGTALGTGPPPHANSRPPGWSRPRLASGGHSC